MEEIVLEIVGRKYFVDGWNELGIVVCGEFFHDRHRLFPGLLNKLVDALVEKGFPVTTDRRDMLGSNTTYRLGENSVTFAWSRGVAWRMIDKVLRAELATDPEVAQMREDASQISRRYYLAEYLGLHLVRSVLHHRPIREIENRFHEKTAALWKLFEHPFKFLLADRITWKPSLDWENFQYRGGDIPVMQGDLSWLHRHIEILERRIDKLVPGDVAKGAWHGA